MLTLEEDLAAWVEDRPDWQKDAMARFCRNESLTPADFEWIADQLIAGTYPVITAIAAAEVPGSSTQGEPVRLVAISGVAGVNALLPGQRLTFGDSGLTVIYGDNASGKSGYARLIREAVTARIKSELLGDVFAQQRADQQAHFEFIVGDASESQSWSLGEATSHALSGIRFYDEEGGDAYVTTASEISYRPSVLTLLDRLSNACAAVQEQLNSRLTANQKDRPALPLLHDGPEAAEFLRTLSDKTTTAQIDAATALSGDHNERLAKKLAEEARLKGSDPTKEKSRLSQLAIRWSTVQNHINRLSTALSSPALVAVENQRKHTHELRAAAKIASSESFDAEPLTGVGSQTWRALWEAARAYSEAEVYHEFPMTGEDARCVLCHQPLQPDAAGRLNRFQAFMTDTTERDAASAENALSASRDALAPLQTAPPSVTTALSQLQAGGEDVAAVETWLSGAITVAGGVVSWLDGARTEMPVAVTDSPSSGVQSRADALRQSGDAIDATTFAETLRTVSAEVRELQSRLALAEAKEQLIAEVSRLKSRVRIERAKQLTDTTGITRKSTDLTKDYVTSVVRDWFTRETEQLHLRRVTLDPTGGRKNVTLEHKPKLLGATVKTQIDKVLSEGEQTALGLAGFLTEVALDSSKSAVVLDDPVSSLDAGRRSRVAKRLVELAKDRQVIVFTHEATFINALSKEARDQGVPVTERAIRRKGDLPGEAVDQHPWHVKDTKKRIHELETELARLNKERDQLDSDTYSVRAQLWGGRLSQAWERAVNLEIVNEVVDRGTNEVRPMKFRILAMITEQDNNDFQSGYAKVSGWAPRHDQAPEVNFMPPEPDEMDAELKRFREWFGRVAKYRNS